MTQKEKAQELVDKYRTYIRAADKYEYLDPEDEPNHLGLIEIY
jgi:DNA-binding SARP family transcriptional activator